MNIIILTTMNVSIDTDKYTKGLASSGGWIGTLIESIKKLERNDRVEVISVSPTNDNSKDSLGNLTCYHLKGKNFTQKPQEHLMKKFQEIIDDVNPDLIDIQGAEFSIGRDMLLCNFDCPVSVTLQGLPNEIANVYDIGMPKNYKWKNRTLYDWTHFKGELEKQLFMKARGKMSVEILSKADYFIGRTEWDHANTWKINNRAKYFCNNRVLRDEFYDNKWDIEKIVPHTIFGIQGRDSAKGLHIAVEALALLKKEYPDVKLVVPGGYKYDSPKNKMGGFEKHIRNLIKKYSLENNIEFTGALTASQMAERMKTSHVFCQYSLLENSPCSLGEAMLMGVPCVASFVGGTSTYMISEVNALAFERSEVGTLAYTIKRIFDNNELALRLSENAKKDAAVRFSKDNVKSLFEIYDKIYEDTKGKR